MKRITAIGFIVQCCIYSLWALTIPQGTLYFDNSKTAYSTVKFVFGRDDMAKTYVLDMTNDGQKWAVTIAQTQNDMYRFTFVGGAIEAGTYEQRFSDFKEYISHTLNINRTATSEAQMNAGDIFVPVNGDNWAQGSWTSLASWEISQGGNSGSVSITGTLPVVYLNTTDGVAITSKEEYITGSLYIDPMGSGYEALGSDTVPVTGQFKGRGNWTWSGFDKKPYRIKFDDKQSVLGMPKNRHWVLIASADDPLGFLKNPAGFMLSEAIGLRWTPRMVPVELMLNGKYQGLYFLTEHVRTGSKRVNIQELPDNTTAADSITGGWLVEIDNYQTENNIEFHEGNGQKIMVSLKEPEILSPAQRQYLESQLLTLNASLYDHQSSLPAMLDFDEAAKYYLVQEIMEDCESYHGSCFLYKDRDSLGTADKWKFGPVWDFGNAYFRHQERWIYDGPIWPQYWIGQLATWPEFQEKVQEQWYIFYHEQKDSVRNAVRSFADLIEAAAKNDANVWRGTQNYCDNSHYADVRDRFFRRFNWRVNWLYDQWGEGVQPKTDGMEQAGSQAPEAGIQKILRNGKILILRNGETYTITGQIVK